MKIIRRVYRANNGSEIFLNKLHLVKKDTTVLIETVDGEFIQDTVSCIQMEKEFASDCSSQMVKIYFLNK